MSDRIAIYNKGKIEQIAVPKEIYENPVNAFVADFIGESNFLPVDLLEDRNGLAELRIKAENGSVVHHRHTKELPAGKDLKLIVRPEKVLIDVDLAERWKIEGIITDVIYLGEMVRYIALVDGKYEVIAKQQTVDVKDAFSFGQIVQLGWDDTNAMVL